MRSSERTGKGNENRAQVIKAPSLEAAYHKKSVFLAGTTSGSCDWREVVAEQLETFPITLFNPLRKDWDSSWNEELTCAPYVEQVEWELQKQETADVVVVYFGAGTDAPISLLELGLCAKEQKAMVLVQDGYSKKGNVQILCRKYGIDVISDLQGLGAGVRKMLGL